VELLERFHRFGLLRSAATKGLRLLFGLFLAGWRRFDIAVSPTFTAMQREKQPQILHCVQDDKRSTQRDLKCDCPANASLRDYGAGRVRYH